MNSYFNPYFLRASETMESDDVFIRLLSAEPLSNFLEKNQIGTLWGRKLYIRSSPGGGKTSLLRLFGPSVLAKITTQQKELHTKLSQLDVLDGNNIKRWGVYSLVGRDFSMLEDSGLLNEVEQKRVFFALLNARIVLATLKSIAIKLHLDKNQFQDVEFRPSNGFASEHIEGRNVMELFEWARRIELQLMKALDDYDGDNLIGHNSLFVFEQLKASSFYYHNAPICEEFIFQLDDAHKFTESQKRHLREELVESRNTATIWIAERLESLTTSEILDDNNIPHRDYEEIRLDEPNKGVSSTLKKITALRSSYSDSGIVLSTALSEINPDASDARYARIIIKYKEKVKTYPAFPLVAQWLHLIDSKKTLREIAVYYRALLIFVARNGNINGENQMRLFSYAEEDMEIELSTLVQQVERFFNCENKLVSYFGDKTLYDMSSFNIEQFLNFASAMYELLLSKKLASPNHYELTTEEQDRIYRGESNRRFSELQKFKGGIKVQKFLNELMNFCVKETYTDAHSYQVVSGFAVLDENNYSKELWFLHSENAALAEVLRLCLAYNLLVKVESKQGAKEQKWTVFYLNRWLCVHCGIPLDRGGWKKLSVKKLKNWL